MPILQSKRYFAPAPSPTVDFSAPDYDMSARTLTIENAYFSAIYAAAAYSDTSMRALAGVRQVRSFTSFHVDSPLISTCYAMHELSGYYTFTFSPTDNKGDLALQICMSDTKKHQNWNVLVSDLHAKVVEGLMGKGLLDYTNSIGNPGVMVCMGHSLGAACAVLFSAQVGFSGWKGKYISTLGGLKVWGKVDPEYTRNFEAAIVTTDDPVPDFPPGTFVSANPDYVPILNPIPVEISRYIDLQNRYEITSTGVIHPREPDNSPPLIDGIVGSVSLAAKLSSFTQHNITTYLNAISSNKGLGRFDSMRKVCGF
jgi:Lipase (class 3)